MDESYKQKMADIGYDHLVCDIFGNWENVKDEILTAARKTGSGSGTIHVFLGAADAILKEEFASYYDDVANGEDPAAGAIEIKHYFIPSNLVSMLGHLCQYLHRNGSSSEVEATKILEAIENEHDESGLFVTKSLFKLSVGSSKLRPYFKQFDSNGAFVNIVRPLLLPNSSYKISLFKNDDGEYAAFWLIGFDWMRDFEADSSASSITTHRIDSSAGDNYAKIFAALRTKPFMLLAGISGTGKSRIVRELAFRSCPKKLQDADGTTPGNYLMVEVKPNWHDSTELLGYYSNISKKYQSTKFVEFLALAKENPDVPFFVCLDEMNLAPVEQYFAEFLSILETRRHPAGDPVNIKTGVLVKEAYMKEVDGWKGGDLTLPDNVFIIGTVNMDDTTHKFSRKVIDRAMTIEMNGGDLESMFGASKNLSYTEEWSLADFKPTFVQADEVVSKYGEYDIKVDTPDKIEAINKCLKGTPFEVSYRVLNELCVYLGVLLDSGTPYGDAIDEAVDQITLMKILPRIEGDEDLFKGAKGEENKLHQLRALFSEDSETYKKLTEMIARLDNGFTRFWP